MLDTDLILEVMEWRALHEMPLTLPPQHLRELAAYIRKLQKDALLYPSADRIQRDIQNAYRPNGNISADYSLDA